MGFFSFFGFYGKNKVKNLAENVTSKIVAIDPEGATEAQLNMMLEKLSEISRKVAQYQRAYEKEKQETQEMEDRLDRAISALQILEQDLETAPVSQKMDIERAMDRLLDEVDKLEAEVEREKNEDKEAKEMLDTFQIAEKNLADKILQAKENLKKLTNEIEKAKVKRELAEEKLEAKKEVAGFNDSLDSLDIASNYMQKELENLQNEEQALKSQAELLQQNDSIDSDDIITKALQRAEGTNNTSRSERLRKLKERRRN
jgi:chromosome segregation ATPase